MPRRSRALELSGRWRADATYAYWDFRDSWSRRPARSFPTRHFFILLGCFNLFIGVSVWRVGTIHNIVIGMVLIAWAYAAEGMS